MRRAADGFRTAGEKTANTHIHIMDPHHGSASLHVESNGRGSYKQSDKGAVFTSDLVTSLSVTCR